MHTHTHTHTLSLSLSLSHTHTHTHTHSLTPVLLEVESIQILDTSELRGLPTGEPTTLQHLYGIGIGS